jgi:hypothetical protein
MALFDQTEIFARGDVGARTRLVSHLVIAALLVGGLWGVEPGLAIVAGVVLAVHVCCDVAWDAWRGELWRG